MGWKLKANGIKKKPPEYTKCKKLKKAAKTKEKIFTRPEKKSKTNTHKQEKKGKEKHITKKKNKKNITK